MARPAPRGADHLADRVTIHGVAAWKSNAHLLDAAHRLGYIRKEDAVLDATYGRGLWWATWRPPTMVTMDLIPTAAIQADFRVMPFVDGAFDVVAYDPPYRLNGTPSAAFDRRYGTHERTRWYDRHALIEAGIADCVRVLRPKGVLLLKCADQVCSGKVRWQTRVFSDAAEREGCELVDRMDMIKSRPQPPGRGQLHARRNTSTLLIFRKAKR